MNAQQKQDLRVPAWTFGDRIRKARHETGMGQKEFAEAIGITASSLAAYETGRSHPRFGDVPVLAKRLEMLTRIPRTWFMGFETMDYGVVVSLKGYKKGTQDRPRGRVDSRGPKRAA